MKLQHEYNEAIAYLKKHLVATQNLKYIGSGGHVVDFYGGDGVFLFQLNSGQFLIVTFTKIFPDNSGTACRHYFIN